MKMPTDPNPYDRIVAAASGSPVRPKRPTEPHLDLLTDFAKRNKLTVGSTTGGRHNVGSRHYTGNAIDIKGSGAFDDATVNNLKTAATSQGLLVRDERRRPPRQKVWGGPHVHIEYVGDGQQPKTRNPYDDIVKAASGGDVVAAAADVSRPARSLQGATVRPMVRRDTSLVPGMGQLGQLTHQNLRSAGKLEPWGAGTVGDGVAAPEVRVTRPAGNLRQLDDPETARILRIQKLVTSEQSPAERNLKLRPGARLMDARPSENEDVVSRASAEKAIEDEQRSLMARRPEIDALKAKFKEFAGQGHGARLIESVQGALANSGVQAGNLISTATLGRRGSGLTEQMRLAQIALGELEQEDPDKGWIAAAERTLPGAAVELAKMSTLSRVPVAGRGTLPGLGALSEADKGMEAATKGAIEGEAFHQGFTKMAGLSKPAKFAVGTSIPAGIAIAQGEDPKKAILSNTAFGAMAVIGPEGRSRKPEGARNEAAAVGAELGGKGRNKDFTTRAGMIRAPAKAAEQPLSSEEPPPYDEIVAAASGEKSTTSPKDAAMAVDREALGLPELERLPTVSAPEVLAKAKEANAADPRRPDVLIEQALRGGKNFTNVETMQVNLRAQEIKNRISELNKEIANDTDPQSIADKGAEQDALIDQYGKISEAQDMAGAEWSRAGTARQRAINQDFSLEAMVARAKKARKGRDLTDTERETIKTQHAKITELEERLAVAQEKGKTKSLQREIDKVQRTARRQETKAVLDGEFAALKQQFAVAKKESRAGVQASGLAGLDPEGKLTPLIAKMARNRVKAGVTDAVQLVDEIHSALREHIEGLSKEDIRDAVMGFGFPDSANKRRQTQLLKQEAELQRRLGEGDFSKVKREPPVYTRETAGLQKQIEQIKSRYNNELYKATRGTKGRIVDTVASFGNLPKSLKSMADVSAMFRQGGFYALTHPIEGLAKPTKAMLQAFTETGHRNVENAIKSDANFDLAKRSGVEFTGVDKNDPKLAHKEERYMGTGALDTLSKGRANPLRAVKGIADFSERTFVSFLDSQRMHIFNQMVEGLKSQGITQRSNPEAYKAIAKLINQGTGRGNLGRMGNNAAPLLNLAMFSPRLVASRVQLLNNMFNPAKMASMPKGARAIMIKDNVKFLAATVALLTVAKNIPGWDVNTDSDDGDFLKIRAGRSTYDTLTGLQQPLRYIMNMGNALKGDALRLGGGVASGFGVAPNRVSESLSRRGERANETYAGKSKLDLTTRFARSKLAPLAGVATDYLTGEDFSGRKFNAGREVRDLITPLPANDFIDAMKAEGLIGALKAAPGLTGIGVQTYDQSPEKATTHAEKLARKMVRDKMPDEARTDEEIDKSKKISDLRARSRRGEDISSEIAGMGTSLTARQTKALLNARNVTKLQEDVKGLTLKDALLIYSVSKPDEQVKLRDIIGEKAATIDLMKIEDQAAIRKQMADLGFKPGESRPKRPERPDRPDRVNRRAWSYAP